MHQSELTRAPPGQVLTYLKIRTKSWITGRRPEHAYAARQLPDPVHFSSAYPRVAVQLPMFNEKAVCQAIIDSACELAWPRERFCVQARSRAQT